jgi:hypothetical protein
MQFLKRLILLSSALTVALVCSVSLAEVSRTSWDRLISTTTQTFGANSLARWSITTAGVFQQDASNGSSIIMQRNGSYLRQSQVQTSAAGSTISDCTALTRVFSRLNTVASGTGACLPDVDGVALYVHNMGANDAELYPPAAGQINGLSAGTPITLAAATNDLATCFQTGANVWSCSVAPGPES